MLSFLAPIIQLFQVLTATVAAVLCFVISGIAFGASVVGLALATPLFIIFSPILVPATITTTVLTGAVIGITALTISAMALLRWLLKDRIGVKPKNNPPPKGAPKQSDKPSVNPEGDTPAGTAGGGQPGGNRGDKPGGNRGDKPGGHRGDKPGGNRGDKPGGNPGDQQPEGQQGGKLKGKGKKEDKPDAMGGDKQKEEEECEDEET